MGVHCYGLRDDQRARIEGMLPGRKGSAGRAAGDKRFFVEAVLYRYRAGVPWRDLPERFGDFRVAHTRALLHDVAVAYGCVGLTNGNENLHCSLCAENKRVM